MHDEDPGPIVQRLILGERLRALREASGISLEDANAALGWYRGKLSKVEMGTLGTSEKELDTLLRTYTIRGPKAEQVRQLGRDARRRAAPERVSDWAKQYIPLERAATEIRMVYSEIPGMLQTKEYARAQLSRSPVVTAADLDGMATAREERGNRLYSAGAPQVFAVLGEEALLRRVGTHEEMKAQLQRLVEMAELPTVSVRVIPLDNGPYAGLSCPFTLLWIEKARTTIAYVETITGADYIKSVGAYTLAFDQAENDSLSPDDSRKLIENYLGKD
ncbi:helix-turn-helix transcriptional regulator [Saccharopolyspora sp. TS4A08]|uniref:Helix-turn-helix transcriptional regulator n=1 Tax=Saccharopolyspora ipomoeae TaxID=3042027 RepID=A0ABT6PQZ9_9PSEU|nr:helix-turn-helix transcriptional regulator [Saccharopolyspora sp. TS4A08]MDI2030438.1 helix-turn-helix transcriptional regulator [Saccharopolyspora sp. TS4A08]